MYNLNGKKWKKHQNKFLKIWFNKKKQKEILRKIIKVKYSLHFTLVMDKLKMKAIRKISLKFLKAKNYKRVKILRIWANKKI